MPVCLMGQIKTHLPDLSSLTTTLAYMDKLTSHRRLYRCI